jgi:hypothetical protein
MYWHMKEVSRISTGIFGTCTEQTKQTMYRPAGAKHAPPGPPIINLQSLPAIAHQSHVENGALFGDNTAHLERL